MSFRSLASLRVAAFFAVSLFLTACEGDRPVPLSGVETIDVPSVEVGPNPNINNPTLVIPDTFPVSEGDELTLVWNEEFDGPEIHPETWYFETGDGTDRGIPGWGNNELQYYLPDNAQLVNGVLELTARRETVGDFNYTSARINTEDRFAFKYGRIEASIKLPSGQGLWPAFWMLSQDSNYVCGVDDEGNDRPCVWAATGEIDIMEAVNLDGTGGNEIFGTIHYGGEFPANQSAETRYTPGVDVTEDFHTYALEWDADEIRWYFNGELYAMQNSWSSAADGEDFPAPFNQNFHILLNLAVGGNFPGDPNGVTPFPATMEVDWVRVYSGEDPAGAAATEPNASAPTPTEDPADVVSLFSDAYDDIAGIDYNPNWGQATVVTIAQIAGNEMLRYGGLDYQGIDFAGNPQDVSDKGFLHVDVWTADSTALNVYLISPGAETPYVLPVTPNSWVSVDIPLTEFDGVDLTNLIQLKFDGNGTIFLDNLYFAGEAPVTAPEVAAPTPTADPGVVISLFSDAYTNIADIDYNPNWGQATVVTQEDIAGNNTLKYAGLDYQGTDFSANPQDVSGLVSLHLDFWTADSTALNVYLISTDFAETSYALTITPESWVSVDIPLTEFAGVDLTSVMQLKFDGNGTIFLDNLYFEGEAAPTEPAAAPTAPTADAGTVTSVFSNAYTDPAVVNYDPNWGQATDATIESIAGNDVWKLAGLSYQGIDFIDNGNAPAGALDVSGYDTLHIDYWSADATTLNVSLISTGPVETAYNVPITTGSWQSVDIPLSEFSGVVDLTNVIQMKFDDAGSGEAATFFIDNIYFYTAAAATEPSDAPTAPTADAGTVDSVFSNAYDPAGNFNYNPGWGQATIATVESIAGNDVWKLAGLNYQGIDFVEFGDPALDVSGYDTLHIDYWSADATTLNVSLISPGPVETAYNIPITTGSWQSVDIPLSAFSGVVDLTSVIQMKFDDAGSGEVATFFIDNIYFYTAAAATEPSDAPAAPTADAGAVDSVFSNAYTPAGNFNYNPGWGQATIATVESIAGNDVWKLAGLNYQGIDFVEFGDPALDVSGYDTLHIDYWSADATTLNVSLISPGPVETAYNIPITTGSWQSVDIPLSAFSGVVDLTSVIQMKFDDAGSGEVATFFIDNIYFYTAAAATEPSDAPAAPTADAGAVDSVFSNAYTPAGNFNYNPGWGQATIATVESIAGNDVWKLAGLNYQGIDFVEFGDPALDVSGYDTLHIDYWSADATTLNVSLISPGPVETAYNIPITTGSWQSVDIPLSAFSGVVDLTSVIQMKFDDAGSGEVATFFIDNIYFYTAGGGAGVELTTNGDFEAGDISGWEDFSAANNGTFTATMAEANGGLWSGNLVASVPGGGGPASFPVVKQANIGIGTVQPNSTVTVSFDLKGSIVGTGGVIFVEFFSELSGGGTSQDGIISQPVPTSSWENFSIPVTTGNDVSGGVTLQLKADCGANAGCTVDAYFDNVSVVTN